MIGQAILRRDVQFIDLRDNLIQLLDRREKRRRELTNFVDA